MKKELEWIRRQPKARGTKSKSRVDRFDMIKKKVESRRVNKELNIDLKMNRIGGKILELKNVKKKYGDATILKGFNYSFKKGERIGILGKNGVGKSTFLNIISGTNKQNSSFFLHHSSAKSPDCWCHYLFKLIILKLFLNHI